MYKNTYLLIFILSFLITSLSFSQKKDTDFKLNEWVGKKIQLPEINTINNIKKVNINPLDKKMKILTLINGECSLCVDNLMNWKEYMRKFDTSMVGFVFVIYYSSYDQDTYLNNSNLIFDYPYFEDYGRQYLTKNKFHKEKNNQTFLLNESNEIILVGNPNFDHSTNKLFLKKIDEKIHLENEEKLVRLNKRITTHNISNNNFIYKNEDGDILSKKDAQKMLKTGNYMPSINSNSKTITLMKRGRN